MRKERDAHPSVILGTKPKSIEPTAMLIDIQAL